MAFCLAFDFSNREGFYQSPLRMKSFSRGGFKHGLTEGTDLGREPDSSLARLPMKFLEAKHAGQST